MTTAGEKYYKQFGILRGFAKRGFTRDSGSVLLVLLGVSCLCVFAESTEACFFELPGRQRNVAQVRTSCGLNIFPRTFFITSRRCNCRTRRYTTCAREQRSGYGYNRFLMSQLRERFSRLTDSEIALNLTHWTPRSTTPLLPSENSLRKIIDFTFL